MDVVHGECNDSSIISSSRKNTRTDHEVKGIIFTGVSLLTVTKVLKHFKKVFHKKDLLASNCI